jgi:ferredoxin
MTPAARSAREGAARGPRHSTNSTPAWFLFGKLFTIGCTWLKSIFKPKEDPMKVTINGQCMGDRNCHKLCPDVFDYDEDQLLAIVKFDEIPEKYHELVRQAARECVPAAIDIEE